MTENRQSDIALFREDYLHNDRRQSLRVLPVLEFG